MTIELRPFQFANNARSTLQSAISAASTQLQVAEGKGDTFPVVDGTYDEIFSVILWDPTISYYEVVYCTAKAGDLLTVERAKEGTTARAFEAGSIVVHNVTAGFFQALTGGSPSTPVLSSSLVAQDITLDWTESVPAISGVTITGYDVYRKVGAGAFALYDSVDGLTLTYADTGLSTGTTYSYYVIARASAGADSAASNTVSETTAGVEYFVIAADDLGVYGTTGKSWTAGASSGVSKTHAGIAHHPGLNRWLTCGAGGAGDTQYSDDAGATWTSQTSGTGQNMERCRYAFGYFFMGSNNGGVFRSATGLSGSWTQYVNTVRSYGLWLNDAGRLASCGNSSSDTAVPTIRYTDDGTNWNIGSVTGLPTGSTEPKNTLYGIAYDEDRALWWVINGLGGIYSTNDIAAGTWTLRYTVDEALASGASFAFKPGGGNEPIVVTTGRTGIWTSVDGGDTFIEHSGTVALVDSMWSDYVGLFMGVGSADLYWSEDGETWNAATETENQYGAIGKAAA